MTPKGANLLIEHIDLRIFDIDDSIARLLSEKEKLRARREELEWESAADDSPTIDNSIRPTSIVIINA